MGCYILESTEVKRMPFAELNSGSKRILYIRFACIFSRNQTVKIMRNRVLALIMIALSAAVLGMAAIPAACQPPTLYPGEHVVQLAGYPAMLRFFKGDPQKPLLVFIPGQSHLARIAYGAPGTRPEDFLAYWLQKEGYNFLAFSFPIASLHPVFDKPYPDYTGEIWGQQIALAAQQTIKENGLSNKIVLLNWSMGGRAMEIATAESRKLGLDVEAGISMAATPPIPRGMPKSVVDMLHKDDSSGRLAMIHADEADNGHTIIPVDVYTNEFVGDMPLSLATYSSFDMNDYPLVAVLMDSKQADPTHALGDPSAWAFVNGRTASRIGSASAKSLTPEKWDALLALDRTMDERLRTPVGGNHFFFVGEKGARTAAEAIDRSIQAVDSFKKDWSAITGKPFE